MIDYYDIILALIPFSVIAVSSILIAAGATGATALLLGCACAVGVMSHAMFVHRMTPTVS